MRNRAIMIESQEKNNKMWYKIISGLKKGKQYFKTIMYIKNFLNKHKQKKLTTNKKQILKELNRIFRSKK